MYSTSCYAKKYYLLHSGDSDCIKSNFQMQGVFKSISDIGNSYKVFYMNSTIKHVSDASLKEIANYAYKNITEYKPDNLIVFGNTAFTYIVPLVKNSIPITFVGITENARKYADEFNIGGVLEIYDIDLFYKFISASHLSLWKINLLYDPSPESRYVLKQITNDFSKFKIRRYEITEISSYNELTKKVINLSKQGKNILVSCLRKVDRKRIILPEQTILHIISKLNRSLLEVSTKSYSTHPSIGFAIGISPDYYDMGREAGELVLVNGNRIIESETTLSINTQRTSELGFIEIYKKSNKLFSKIYSYYE